MASSARTAPSLKFPISANAQVSQALATTEGRERPTPPGFTKGSFPVAEIFLEVNSIQRLKSPFP